MEQLSKEYFDQWMNRITEHQEQMMGELRQLKAQSPDTSGDGMIDDADFCQILNISARTSQRYRTEGLIPYSVLRQRVYYKESDVWTFIHKNRKDKGGQLSEKLDQLNNFQNPVSNGQGKRKRAGEAEARQGRADCHGQQNGRAWCCHRHEQHRKSH